jgi:radical SAM protein with 4Fe4S-binding SPASM domain
VKGGVRARAERFGAIVAMDEPPALISVNRAFARRLGVAPDGQWGEDEAGLEIEVLRAPTEVHLAATMRCPAACTSCYADATPRGHEPSFDEVVARIDALASASVFSIAFGGGEAALREDIVKLAAHARARGLMPTLTTSGLGMNSKRAESFRVFAQVNVSYDGATDVSTSVRGYDGATVAKEAMRCLGEAGVPFGINTVLTRTSYEHVADTARDVQALGACEMQLLRFKPSGRGRMNYLAERLTFAQIDSFAETLRTLSTRHSFALRIDCALMPFLVQAKDVSPEAIATFGVMGCEAGRSLCATKSDGSMSPCSFWDGGPSGELDFQEAWEKDPTLSAFRSYVRNAPEPCKSCEFRQVCRSGCRIVARELTGDAFAPDPECPRVRSMRETDPARSST